MTPHTELWRRLQSELEFAARMATDQRKLYDLRLRLDEALKMVSILEREIPVVIECCVPSCWKDLVSVVFDSSTPDIMYEGRLVEDASHCFKNDDPKPYHCNVRVCFGKNADGWGADIRLCSDRNRYWGEIQIITPTGDFVVERIFGTDSTFEEVNIFHVFCVFRTFQVLIKWEK